MRFYQNFRIALSEIARDLAELGILVHPQTMQDKYVADDPAYETKECQNYIYTVLEPRLEDLSPTEPWFNQEWSERVNSKMVVVNPGTAWMTRLDVWREFIEDQGEVQRFAYTYSERIGLQLVQMIEELKRHPETRQAFMAIWDRETDPPRMGIRRVPCSLGYWFARREGHLHLTYLQRSSDFATHFVNDIALATRTLHYVAAKIDVPPGRFVHWIGSLHVYQKDVEGVF